ncbi:MAG: hypothetical protein RLZZ341_1325 [Pseudomonadota bacterium]
MNSAANPGGAVGAPTPGVVRRLAAFLYEGVLVFGIVALAGLAYGLATQQRHALVGSAGLQAFLFGVLGLYFVISWVRSGQTLAMLTWHLRLVTVDGHPLRPLRAVVRYVLAWAWVLPGLGLAQLAGLKGGGPVTAALLGWVLFYAALSRLHPDRQFLHDALCRTRLITWYPPHRARSAPAP